MICHSWNFICQMLQSNNLFVIGVFLEARFTFTIKTIPSPSQIYILSGNYLTNRKLKIFNSIDDELITFFLKNECLEILIYSIKLKCLLFSIQCHSFYLNLTPYAQVIMCSLFGPRIKIPVGPLTRLII
jgi:hypothetical protein